MTNDRTNTKANANGAIGTEIAGFGMALGNVLATIIETNIEMTILGAPAP